MSCSQSNRRYGGGAHFKVFQRELRRGLAPLDYGSGPGAIWDEGEQMRNGVEMETYKNTEPGSLTRSLSS